MCYRTAAQVFLDAHAPLTVHPEPSAVPVESVPRAATDLLTQQAAAEMGAHQESRARETLATVTSSARLMAGVLGAAAIALGMTVVTLPLWLPRARTLETEVRLTLTAGLFLLVSTALTVATASDTAQLVAPRWLRALGKLVRLLRQ